MILSSIEVLVPSFYINPFFLFCFSHIIQIVLFTRVPEAQQSVLYRTVQYAQAQYSQGLLFIVFHYLFFSQYRDIRKSIYIMRHVSGVCVSYLWSIYIYLSDQISENNLSLNHWYQLFYKEESPCFQLLVFQLQTLYTLMKTMVQVYRESRLMICRNIFIISMLNNFS